jgi:hypothetical protein
MKCRIRLLPNLCFLRWPAETLSFHFHFPIPPSIILVHMTAWSVLAQEISSYDEYTGILALDIKLTPIYVTKKILKNYLYAS